MAKATQTITTNGDTLIGSLGSASEQPFAIATLFAQGTWGGGTITWKISYDGGTTLINIKDNNGVVMTSSANDTFNISTGMTNKASDVIKIYATLSGATSPSLTVGFFDNLA